MTIKVEFLWFAVAASLLKCDASSLKGDLDSLLLNRKSLSTLTNKQRILAFGDYAEVPESCPAFTTCPVICVEEISSCPTACPDDLSLCADGSCSTTCDPSIESPCECETRPFACAKVNDYYPNCTASYAYEYAANMDCIENQEEALPQVSFTGPVFLFCYYFISGVTLLVVVWCFYNQKVSPIPASVKTLTPTSMITTTTGDGEEQEWTQTGYKKNLVGTIISYLVWTNLWGIQCLLALTTILYYQQQEAILTSWPPVFHDEVQILLAFQLVWFVGFVWSFLFQWPESIESLFLRRCPLPEATHVAVIAPLKKFEMTGTSKTSTWGDITVRLMCFPFDCFLRTMFSYNGAEPGYELVYCKVDIVETSVPSFYFRMGRYVLSDEEGKYIPGSMEVGKTIGDFISKGNGLTTEEAEANYNLVGPNIIPIDKPTVFGSLYKEFSKTFYIYQNFMVWSWYPYWNQTLAVVQTVIRLIGGITVAAFQHQSDAVLYKLSLVEGDLEVIRDGSKTIIPVKYIVPGDVVVIKPGVVYSDMAIIKSEHLVVDESALTGESNQIAKAAMDVTMSKLVYDRNRHKNHTVFAGTEVTECGGHGEELGIVLTTGSFTTKGKLLSDVLSYQRHKFLFDDEIKIVLLILVIQSVILLSLVFSWLSEQFVYAWFYGIYIVGTVLPPLLPTVFVVSVGISANRLQQRRITCTNSEGILVAGKVNVCCFDKTGTLTHPGLDFVGVESSDNDEIKIKTYLGMSVCHSLKVSDASGLIGNHVDKACFEASGGIVTSLKGESAKIEHNGAIYTVLKQFDFDNHFQTQSVIVADEKGQTYVFVKGSPEAIKPRCEQDTVPDTFEQTLRTGAKSGGYQLSIAFKNFEITKDIGMISREEVECRLTFGGFICFRNFLRNTTPPIMKELNEANVLVTMITGDSVLTGIAIAREAGMVRNQSVILGRLGEKNAVEWEDADSHARVDQPHSFGKGFDLAITGEAWSALLAMDPEYAYKIARYVRVFGRCNPTDKVSVVTVLGHQGYITMMCGDGQNDCGALKSAHVGVSLSSSDASIVAPFTSLDKDVQSVIYVLREGRCALSSAFKAYTYYILYGQIETYLQTINAYLSITFSEWCWIFLDALWSACMAFSLPLARAAKELYICRPTASLLGPRTFSSVAGLLFINFFFLCMGMVALHQQDWYQCRKWNSEDVSSVTTIGDNYESSTLFIVGGYQYVSTAIALNFGYKFRAPWYTNYIFNGFVVFYTIFHLVMTLHPSSFSCIFRVNCVNENVVRSVSRGVPLFINNPYNTTVMPLPFRWILVGILVANTVALCLWEYLFVNTFLYRISKFGKDDPLSEPFLSECFQSLPFRKKDVSVDSKSDE